MARGGAAKPMANKYSGPFKVLERRNKGWKLQVGERVDVISWDCLKSYLGSVAPKAAMLPRPRRPRMDYVVFVAFASGAAEPGGPV